MVMANRQPIIGPGRRSPSGVDSREESQVAGSGTKPPEAENHQFLGAHRKQQIRLIRRILKTGESSCERDQEKLAT